MAEAKPSAAKAQPPVNDSDPKLSATGTQAMLGGAAEPYSSSGGGHPTLNTKPLFKLMVEKKASDLFFTSNAPIKIKIEGQILPVNKQVLTPETVRQTSFALMSAEQREYFTREYELDFAISEPGLGRFRVNVFMQRGYPAMVLRYIEQPSPHTDSLSLLQVAAAPVDTALARALGEAAAARDNTHRQVALLQVRRLAIPRPRVTTGLTP